MWRSKNVLSGSPLYMGSVALLWILALVDAASFRHHNTLKINRTKITDMYIIPVVTYNKKPGGIK